MVPAPSQTKLARNSNAAQLLGIGFGIAVVLVFAAPLLSGSNHTCPVLRQQDLERGPSAQAVPAFARKYNVDCTYCHTAWPQLNRTGIVFRYLGYRMPWEVPTGSGGGAPSATAPTAFMPPGTPAAALPPALSAGLKQGMLGSTNQAPTPERIAEGQKVFQQMQCFTCHTNGDNMIDPSKPIKGANFLKKYPEDAQIADIIRHGRPGTAMPGYNNQRLTDGQLSALLTYIRSLTPPKS